MVYDSAEMARRARAKHQKWLEKYPTVEVVNKGRAPVLTSERARELNDMQMEKRYATGR
jgi:hypothetical protein